MNFTDNVGPVALQNAIRLFFLKPGINRIADETIAVLCIYGDISAIFKRLSVLAIFPSCTNLSGFIFLTKYTTVFNLHFTCFMIL